MTKEQIRKKLEERKSALKVEREKHFKLADRYSEYGNYPEESWHRTRALELSARINEIEITLCYLEV